MRDKVIALLRERGVELTDFAELVYSLQHRYQDGLTLEECLACVLDVLGKREVQFAFLTGIALDALAERGLLPEPLQELVASDNPLYGVDETLALAITNIYGSIGLTNFGYLDKQKVGVLARLDQPGDCSVHTFLDDLVAGTAAAAAARLAHKRATCDGLPAGIRGVVPADDPGGLSSGGLAAAR